MQLEDLARIAHNVYRAYAQVTDTAVVPTWYWLDPVYKAAAMQWVEHYLSHPNCAPTSARERLYKAVVDQHRNELKEAV